MLFLCYPKCTTCQKAQKWLVGLRNIKEANPHCRGASCVACGKQTAFEEIFQHQRTAL